VAELIAIVSHLPRETILLPIQYVRDRAGNNYLSRDVFSQIAAASTALSMRFQTTYLGEGTVGGFVVHLAKAGKVTADTAAQILPERPRQMSPWSRPECSEPCGTELRGFETKWSKIADTIGVARGSSLPSSH